MLVVYSASNFYKFIYAKRLRIGDNISAYALMVEFPDETGFLVINL
jgi:hypothetical protein